MLRRSLRDGDIDVWAPYALAVFFAFGSLLAVLVAALPGRAAPAGSLAIAAMGLVTAIALLRFPTRLTPRLLLAVLAAGVVCVALGAATAQRPDGADGALFAWVGMYAGFFLGARPLLALIALIAVSYSAVLLVWPGIPGRLADAPQAIVLTVGSVTATGVWSLVLRRVAGSLLARQQRLASTDALTGLPNRSVLVRRGTARAQGDRRWAMLLVDLDDFKLVNDTDGHAAGDELLCDVASRLRAGARAGDLVARLGGDEFAVLLDRADPGPATAAAQRVHRLLTRPAEGQAVRASIGIAWPAGDHADFGDVLRDADAAMYAAKHDGDGWRTFCEDMRAAAAERRILQADLADAIERELTLHYQPMTDLRTGATAVVEALVRWEHPDRGLVGPDRFIGIAERTGDIVALGRWVLRTACAQAAGWAAPAPVVSVNLSPRQLLDPELVDQVRAALAAAALPPERLMLEITESTVIADPERAVERLTQLRRLGVRLAVDDFGTGESSLAALQRLPVTDLKLAREFARGLTEDPALVRGILALGQALRLRTVAEGVEEPAQLELLRELGADLAQGFLLARPMTAEALDAHLAAVALTS